MAFAFITEFPIQADDRTTANYDAVNDRLTDEVAPSGLILHYAGFDEDAGVFRIVNVWDSDAQGQAYLDDKVMPAVREVMGANVRRASSTGASPRLAPSPPAPVRKSNRQNRQILASDCTSSAQSGHFFRVPDSVIEVPTPKTVIDAPPIGYPSFEAATLHAATAVAADM